MLLASLACPKVFVESQMRCPRPTPGKELQMRRLWYPMCPQKDLYFNQNKGPQDPSLRKMSFMPCCHAFRLLQNVTQKLLVP